MCAHRGASLELADNSIEAFVAAIASGCDAIETDVRLRGDGTLVLAHDTWDVDVPDVATLDALLELSSGRIGLDLEIVEVGLERAILDAVDHFHGWLIVTSTYPEVLLEMRRLSQHIYTGLVIEAPYDGSPFAGDVFAMTEAAHADVALVEDALATPELFAAADGRPLWVWTVNDEPRLIELLAHAGATGVITDDPALACSLRDEL